MAPAGNRTSASWNQDAAAQASALEGSALAMTTSIIAGGAAARRVLGSSLSPRAAVEQPTPGSILFRGIYRNTQVLHTGVSPSTPCYGGDPRETF